MKKSILIIVITLFAVSAMWISSSFSSKKDFFDVEVVKPQQKSIHDYVNASGRVVERNKKNIFINGVAKVTSVKVEEGQKVKKGEVLAEITPVNYEIESFFDGLPDMSGIEEIFSEFLPDFSLEDYKETTITLNNENVLKSPIDGVITEVNIAVDDNISPLNKLISVSDYSDLYISIMIPEAYSLKVREGAEVEISSDAFEEGIKYMGKIKKVSPKSTYVPSITGEGKTYTKADVSLNTPNTIFRPGLNINAKITINTLNNAKTIPYECIRQDENNTEYVFVISENKVKKQPIKTGHELDNEVEVKSGLGKGSLVVKNPPEDMTDGVEVNIIKSE